MSNSLNNGYLILETGEVFEGNWGTTPESIQGTVAEVVFNTSHSGYEEIATDPSYYSQIVVMTSPMQGNYGVDPKVWESRQIWIRGFVCLQMQESTRDSSWAQLLAQNGVPVLSGVDTRKLTLRLRAGGTPWGALVRAPNVETAKKWALENIPLHKEGPNKDWVFEVSRKNREVFEGQNPLGPRMAVLDLGTKSNIIRELQSRCSEVLVFPCRTSPQEIERHNPQGLLLSNGPGDPIDVQSVVPTIQYFLKKIPIFGICMGHQLLGIALGAKTYKLKFGHRGSNHPIKDHLLNRTYISSQNHGYAIDPESIPSDVKISHWNLNDQTVAGIYSQARMCFGVQFHPESCPGPHDSKALFDLFQNHTLWKKESEGS